MDLTPLIPCNSLPSAPCDLYIATLFLPCRLIIRSTNSLSIKRVINLDPEFARGVVHLQWTKGTRHRRILLADSKCIKAYDMADEQWELNILEELGNVNHVAWTQSGKSIVVWADFQLKLTAWSVEHSAGTIIPNPKFPHKGFVDRTSVDNQWILLQRTSHDEIAIIDTSQTEWHIVKTFPIATSDAQGVSCDAQGNWIAVWDNAIDYKILIYTMDGRLIRTFVAYDVGLGIKTVEWSPDGDFLTLGSFDNQVRFLNNFTFSPVIVLSHNQTIRSENTTVWRQVTSGGYSRYEKADQPISPPYIRTSSLESNQKSGVGILTYSPDGSFLVTKADDMPTTLWIWSLREMSPIAVLVNQYNVRTVLWHPEEIGQLVFTCQGSSITDNNAIYLWNIDWDEPRIVSIPREGFEVKWFRVIPSGEEKESGIVVGGVDSFTIGYPVNGEGRDVGTIAEEEEFTEQDTIQSLDATCADPDLSEASEREFGCGVEFSQGNNLGVVTVF